MQQFKSILLVDDDYINNFISLRLIQKMNLAKQVNITNNGAEGIEFLKIASSDQNDNFPDLIFLDLNMPVMDGFEFIKALREVNLNNPAKCRVIVLTTSKNDVDEARIRSLGVFELLNKPLTKEKLMHFLAQTA